MFGFIRIYPREFGGFSGPLLQLKASAAYNLSVDPDVHPVNANAKRGRVQVVYVLAAIDPEV
jgi:hypothetical protein